jgi:hypothetical protein
MEIQVNDYIQGTEYYGRSTKTVRGWVDEISKNRKSYVYTIQADDNYKGARGTIVFSELGEVIKLPFKERLVNRFI